MRALATEVDLVPVVSEMLADTETPVSVFLRLGTGEGAYLLESVEGGEHLARYSFIGAEPTATLRLDAGEATLEEADAEPRRLRYADPLTLLDELVGRRRAAPAPGLQAPFCGGAVGFLGYEAATSFERLPTAVDDPLGAPDGWFAISDTLVVFDHVTHRMHLVSHARLGDGIDVDDAYDAAVARIEALRSRLRTPLPPLSLGAGADIPTPGTAGLDGGASMSRADFMARVERCIEYILAGDIFQVQISRRFALPLRAAPFDVYRALRSLNPSPYMFYLRTPSCDIVGASPEMLVRVKGAAVDYHPIAGTRRRGRSPEHDRAMEQELRSSEKERAEHLMLVDLGRNDLGRVCATGTVEVTDFMSVERYSHVMHLVSSLRGRLEPGLRAVDALRSCFPAGTVTGAPKLRAMEIIAELESQRRGVYSGAVGYLGFGGNLDAAIALRTLVVRDGVAYAQAAAGIVADSTPAEEALEIDNKVAALLLAVELANRGLER